MNNTFRKFNASVVPAKVIEFANMKLPQYALLKDNYGSASLWSVNFDHGRSFIVGKHDNGRYIVSKGNGLSYTTNTFLHTGEFGDNCWGLLLKRDAIRDFTLGNEISSLGIKTNWMEYVLELDNKIFLPNKDIVNPYLLQYSVECPYRLSDAPFMSNETIQYEVNKWQNFNDKGYSDNYMIAADVLIKNLRILHDNNILHNAISIQNHTWALELVDFELACSNKTPYEQEDYQRHVIDLFPREIIYTYQVISYIAEVLHEKIDFISLDRLFKFYGFDINKYALL